jgi:homocitrate synthase NifV
MKKELKIIDTTLREGEQTPGVHFSLEEKKTIIDFLAKIGVTEIELGTVANLNDSHVKLIEYCRTTHPRLKTSLWSRCKKEDIQLAATMAPDVLSISIPASDIHLKKKLGKKRQWARENVKDSVQYAHKHGLTSAIGFEDATRADFEFLQQLAIIADQNQVSRIRIADTVGIASPGKISSYITQLAAKVECELGVHTHNDFGMASANAIAAFESGAHWADVTVLGLGERTGCARLEEVAGYLALMDNTPLQVNHLKPLSILVADITRLEVDRQRPIIGDAIFTCETGLHLQGLYSSPETYEPFSPERIGARRVLQIGSKSGRKSMMQKLHTMGITPKTAITEQQARAVRNLSIKKQRPLTDLEIINTLQPAS